MVVNHLYQNINDQCSFNHFLSFWKLSIFLTTVYLLDNCLSSWQLFFLDNCLSLTTVYFLDNCLSFDNCLSAWQLSFFLSTVYLLVNCLSSWQLSIFWQLFIFFLSVTQYCPPPYLGQDYWSVFSILHALLSVTQQYTLYARINHALPSFGKGLVIVILPF